MFQKRTVFAFIESWSRDQVLQKKAFSLRICRSPVLVLRLYVILMEHNPLLIVTET